MTFLNTVHGDCGSCLNLMENVDIFTSIAIGQKLTWLASLCRFLSAFYGSDVSSEFTAFAGLYDLSGVCAS